MNNKIKAISLLPSAGLGNKLFSCASGMVFSSVNNCEHVIYGMSKLHIGPYLRREKSKRFYINYFKNEKKMGFISPFFMKQKYIIKQENCDTLAQTNGIYIFNEIPQWLNFFVTLKNHRELIKSKILLTLQPHILTRLHNAKTPQIAVHIRMGDFRRLGENEDFAKVGAVRTPLDYFIEIIQKIRTFLDYDCSVVVFSDGRKEDLLPILNLKNTELAEDNLDIIHLLQMSKAKVLITSAGSTYSYWSGFLSDYVVINHYSHIHFSLRDVMYNELFYEGGIHKSQEIKDIPLLAKNLKDIL
jgi:hypothetical protein